MPRRGLTVVVSVVLGVAFDETLVDLDRFRMLVTSCNKSINKKVIKLLVTVMPGF